MQPHRYHHHNRRGIHLQNCRPNPILQERTVQGLLHQLDHHSNYVQIHPCPLRLGIEQGWR